MAGSGEPPPDRPPSREPFRELARRLATPEGLRTARLQQLAGGLLPPATPPPVREVEDDAGRAIPPGPRPISIWQPRQGDLETVFVRPEPLPWGDHHAARRLLTPRRGPRPRRIAFFGESAAAGYLYAPHLTPAEVLERQLTAVHGPGSWEVLDLARTNESLGPLLATVEASLQLGPDLLVVFAGNNWNLLESPECSPYAPSVAARQSLAAAWAASGHRGLAERAREEVLEKAGRTLVALAQRAREASLPVVLVIPEVNLGDWETRQPVGWLPGGDTRHWWRLHRQAETHLAAGAYRQAVAVAWEMIDLDGETCPTSCRLLTRACLGLGDRGRAELAARAEVDAESYATLCGLGSPRATSWVQDLLRRAAERLGLVTVDLPRLFAVGQGGGGELLPGRRLFLDYCHLSREGMAVAMAAVAARVSHLMGEEWVRPSELETSTRLPAEAEATALLGAAVHTAHRLLPTPLKGELLAWWLEAALATSPGVEAAIWHLVAARAAPLPAALTAAQGENLASPYRLLLQHGWHWDFLDADLLSALERVLAGPGRSERLAGLLLAGQGGGPGDRDLIRPPCLWEPLARFYPECLPNRDLPGRSTLRSPWPVSTFSHLSGGEAPAELTITLRLPPIEGAPGRRQGRVGLTVNGHQAGTVMVGESWSRHRLTVSPELLRRGLNRLELHWPELPPWGDAARATIRRRLEHGLAADLHPVFGEIAALRSGERTS